MSVHFLFCFLTYAGLTQRICVDRNNRSFDLRIIFFTRFFLFTVGDSFRDISNGYKEMKRLFGLRLRSRKFDTCSVLLLLLLFLCTVGIGHLFISIFINLLKQDGSVSPFLKTLADFYLFLSPFIRFEKGMNNALSFSLSLSRRQTPYIYIIPFSTME